MPDYVPEYNEETSIKRGESPPPQAIMARSQLIRERGGQCLHGEVWMANKGWVPVYTFGSELTRDEQEVLCLCPA